MSAAGPTDRLVADGQARLLARIDRTAAEMRPAFPHAANSETGRWEAKAGGAWTDGFWVGLCHTGEAPDHELIWGDHFLLEALARWQGRR